MAVMLKVYFSNSLPKTATWALAVKLLSGECHRTWLIKKPTFVQLMTSCNQATSHYLIQYWPKSMLPYSVTRPQWLNSLQHNDAKWRHRTRSMLVQEMACCLTTPILYLNQCWLINEACWHLVKISFTEDILDITHYNVFENYIFENITTPFMG